MNVGETERGMGTTWLLTDQRYLRQRMPAALLDWLRSAGEPVEVVVGDLLVRDLDSAADPWAGLRRGDLVVARTRHPFALALLAEAELAGARPLLSRAAIEAVRDKSASARVLARAGLPAPSTWLAAGPDALRSLPETCFPLLLKPYLGDNGRGITLVRHRDGLADVDWTDGMALAQQYVDVGGIDCKLYVAGEQVWAVRRPSPLVEGGADVSRPATVTPELRALALACAAAFGLALCGIDVLESPRGPLIVDVNDFPNYTGVPDAPAVIGGLVRQARHAAVAA